MAEQTAQVGFPQKYGVEWWYTAHLIYGAIQLVFIPILIPTFVLEVTGSATTVGLAMALIGLGGLLAPVIGSLADRFSAHRIAQLAGLAAYCLGGVVFALIGTSTLGIFLGAACMGVGSATLLMINPAFVVSGGFAPDDEAIRLTRLNQTMILGSLIAGVGLSALTTAGMDFAGRFITLSVLALFGLAVAFLTNRAAAARIKLVGSGNGSEAGGANLKGLLLSPFGLLLLAVFFVTTGQGAMTGQFPNYMQDVFQVHPGTSALSLSVSAIVSLLILDAIGRWMGKAGPSPVWLAAVATKVAVMAGLSMLALSGGGVGALIPLALYVIYLQAITSVDMVQPALAVRYSTAGAGATQGFLMFAIASAYAIGNFVGGSSADTMGFASLTWIVGLVSAVALALGALCFRKPEAATDGDAQTEVNED